MAKINPNNEIWINDQLGWGIIPKNASSSIRHMIYQYLVDSKVDMNDHECISSQKIKSLHKEKRTSSIKFAIKRDPVERFISSYSDIVYRRNIEMSIEDCLKITEISEKNNKIHFISQYKLAGDINDYDYIFTIDQLDDVANLIYQYTNFLPKVPWIKNHKDTKQLILTSSQEKIIAGHYKDDYDNGWF